MKYLIIGAVCVFAFCPLYARASVIEFTPNGTVLYFDAVDYRNRVTSVKPQSQTEGKAAQKYDAYITQAAEKYGVDMDLIKALISVESQFEEKAISPKGAMGLMQLMPETAKELGLHDPFDPQANIFAGVRFLKTLLDLNAGDEVLALAAYNAGQGAVDRYKNVPPYAETLNYIKKIEAIRNNKKR